MALDALFSAQLPEPLKGHCRVLSVRDNTLVLAADSPVWAARLRFHTTQLVKQLNRQQTVKLRTVRVRVRPPERPRAEQVGYRAKPPGKAGLVALRQTAVTVSDPALKSALLRLANRQYSR